MVPWAMSRTLSTGGREAAFPADVEQGVALVAAERRLVVRLRIEARSEVVRSLAGEGMALEELRAELRRFPGQAPEQLRGGFRGYVRSLEHRDRVAIRLSLI